MSPEVYHQVFANNRVDYMRSSDRPSNTPSPLPQRAPLRSRGLSFTYGTSCIHACAVNGSQKLISRRRVELRDLENKVSWKFEDGFCMKELGAEQVCGLVNFRV
ncbi:hypothetical protein GWI33_004284 [Rhynchophorus ferrugineus]|uniref:Uncharacterized protein n=1 Tax=Rhynchophorus ferrugineus TaxID=354439 RepID=A0A834IJ07_RHYFE|nr:hypothetical protein GWI33_004284 [Rhynchophorus ferrugineus]